MKKDMKRKTILSLSLLVFAIACTEPAVNGPLPSKAQVEWKKMETYAFVHFGLNTFTDVEWGYGNVSPEVFNPTELDCDQWARTFAAGGLKGVVITAKHHDGFCLWPSAYTDYSVAASPVKTDVVGALADACRRNGLKFGVYLSPWDRHQACYGSPEYVEYYRNQMTELMTSYGDIFEVWLDGANGGNGWYGGADETRKIDARNYYDYPSLDSLILSYQPSAVIFSDGGPGCRWVGNEDGVAAETNWSFLDMDKVHPGYPQYWELGPGHREGNGWCAAECDVSIRPGWFYHSAESPKSPRELADLYYKSVGRNANLILNFPVNDRGLVSKDDSLALVGMKEILDRELSKDLLAGKGKGAARRLTDGKYASYMTLGEGSEVVFELAEPIVMSRLMLQEFIPYGQSIAGFEVEYRPGPAAEWTLLDAGEETTTVGYKRILRFEAVTAYGLRLRIKEIRTSTDEPGEARTYLSTVAAF